MVHGGRAFDPAERAAGGADSQQSRDARGRLATVRRCVAPWWTPRRAGARAPATTPCRCGEAGFYEIRPAGRPASRVVVAVNGPAAESDLSPIDPGELTASVDARAAAGAEPPRRDITAEERERRQSLWWYLLAAGLLLLVVEAAVASRLPRMA